MYTFIANLNHRDLAIEHAPAFGASLVIAEALYEFHSFTLECLAFLATWVLLDFAIVQARKRSA